MFEKLKSAFKTKIETEEPSFDTLQISISALLIQTAAYDGVFDDIEKEKIKSLLKKYFDLTDEKLEELFSLSFIVNDESNDIQQFTRKLNENLDYDEKLEIIEMMWKIIIVDGRIDDYENSLIRKISGLLYVQDSDVGEIKNKY
ncbi:MAG: TerB family tellurite resistance protein [Pelagibacterales bacterium]|nr:TerB family tellurite resistance protein [Pelagibacterales bacterium]